MARAVEQQLQQGRRAVPGRISAYVFEAADDPAALLYVGRWESRRALEIYRRQAPQPGPSEWHATPPTVETFEPVATYVEMYAPADIASLLVVDGPPDSAGERRTYLMAYGQMLRAQQVGIVEYEIAEDPDRPGRFAIFARWRTAAERDAHRARGGQRMVDELAGLGATVRRFDGLQRAETPSETPS